MINFGKKSLIITVDGEKDLEDLVALYIKNYEKIIGRKATENDIENIRKKVYGTKKKNQREQNTEFEKGSVYNSRTKFKEFSEYY